MYIGYAKDQQLASQSASEEGLMAALALAQSILLGSFAAILAAHRSEILDKHTTEAGGAGARLDGGIIGSVPAPASDFAVGLFFGAAATGAITA